LTPAETHGPLVSLFLRSAERFPNHLALEVEEATVTYEELQERALRIAGSLLAQEPGGALTAVYGARSVETFAGILGILLRGHGYVPLNPRFPPLRNAEILERSGCRSVVVADAHVDAVREVTMLLADPPSLVVSENGDAGVDLPVSGPETPAYLLFTSGSTGRPKGVLVRQANVAAFLDAVVGRYDLNENDRMSQLFDLTFDLSAFDLFATWQHGACLCCPAPGQLLRPVEFVVDSRLTVWFSVPSTAMFLERLGGLKPGMFPELRISLFCGEALAAELADAWAAAAPNATLDNLYGPTEATIACTAHRWAPGSTPGANGFVPIGEPLGATDAQIVDDELVVSGPQVVDSYWDDPEATGRAFLTLPDGRRAYRTGDRVRRTGPSAPLEYVGRVDNQIKVLGHRVELEEVEAALRAEARTDAIAVGWPRTPSGAAGIVAFIANTSLDSAALRRALSAKLPDYMVPRELRLVDTLPLNANGKLDRKAMLAVLEAE
jgi:amino acid adenylation domain-containing protein